MTVPNGGIVNQPIPPFIINLAGTIMAAAIIGLSTWTITMNKAMEGIRVRQETFMETTNSRLTAQNVRMTDLQNTVASMQVQVVKDLQAKSDDVLNKMEKAEGARETRGNSLDIRLNALVEAISKLSSQVAVVTDRVDNYISDLRGREQPPRR